MFKNMFDYNKCVRGCNCSKASISGGYPLQQHSGVLVVPVAPCLVGFIKVAGTGPWKAPTAVS